MKVLLAEDDPMLGASMEKGLLQAGLQVDWVRQGSHALTAAKAHHYDVVLLDIGLPQIDGLEVLRQWRQQGVHTPVLLVSARDSVRDRVEGLNRGADDYLTKPFDLDELIARAHALNRRHMGRSQPAMQLGNLEVDPIGRVTRLAGSEVHLSPTEFNLLCALAEKPGAVLSLEQLEQRLYSWNDDVSSNAISVHLHNLRRKLGANWVRNIRGVGYKLVEPT